MSDGYVVRPSLDGSLPALPGAAPVDRPSGFKTVKADLTVTPTNGGLFIVPGVARSGMLTRAEVAGPSADFKFTILRGRDDFGLQYGYHHQGAAEMIDDGPPVFFRGESAEMVIKIEPLDGIMGTFTAQLEIQRHE